MENINHTPTQFEQTRQSEKSNPGSYNDYRDSHDTTSSTEVVEQHSAALHAYRLALAAELGMTLDDLHDRRSSYTADEHVA